MTKEELFRLMKGTIIVSCQATPGEPLYDPQRSVMPLMARAARQAGACSSMHSASDSSMKSAYSCLGIRYLRNS